MKRSRNKKKWWQQPKTSTTQPYNNLIKKKQDLQGKELLNAFVKSDKSLDEILAFMYGKKTDEA
jgi:hypothetical protein